MILKLSYTETEAQAVVKCGYLKQKVKVELSFKAST